MKTRFERKTETAKRLTKEVKFQVHAHKSCFALHDGTHCWFPLYSVKSVEEKAKKLHAGG